MGARNLLNLTLCMHEAAMFARYVGHNPFIEVLMFSWGRSFGEIRTVVYSLIRRSGFEIPLGLGCKHISNLIIGLN